MNNNQWFTIYWLDGSKSFIVGKDVEIAFTEAGYGGAIHAVDWYDNGITDTHYHDKQKKEWVRFESVSIKKEEFVKLTEAELQTLVQTTNDIEVILENKDIVVMSKKWSLVFVNDETAWVNHIELTFGEYFQGTYSGDSDDEENTFHYMMANTQYFMPSDINHAIAALMNRVRNNPFESVNTPYSKTLDEIQQLQKEKYAC